MPKPKITAGKLADLKQDPDNARLHNPRNVGLIEDSLNEVGSGRSVFAANDGTIIAGNATFEAAAAAGVENIIFVDSDGDALVVHRRRDIAPGSPEAVRAALYDNRASELATGWDIERLVVLDESDMLAGLWSETEITDITRLSGLPTLDELEEQYGEPDETDLWVTLAHKVPPELKQRFDEVLDGMDGETTVDKITALLDMVS